MTTNQEMTEEKVRELDELANAIGRFIHYWGFKQIHGRVWAHIFVAAAPLDAGTLMKRLNVSKALMSLSLNDLLDYNVIQESSKSKRGTQTYIANPKVIDVIISVLERREKKLLQAIDASCDSLCKVPSDRLNQAGLDVPRLKTLSLMIKEAQATLNSMLDLTTEDFKHWRTLSEFSSELNGPNH